MVIYDYSLKIFNEIEREIPFRKIGDEITVDAILIIPVKNSGYHC